jgi:hypothetical protein
MTRTIEDINRRAAQGEAVVLTAREVAELMEAGKDSELGKVDVVTTSTMGLMSGTYAVLSFPIAPPGKYKRFVGGTMNGVPMVIGPCPNEGIGMIDAIAMLPLSISATATTNSALRGPLLIVVVFGIGCCTLFVIGGRLTHLPFVQRHNRLRTLGEHFAHHTAPGGRKDATVAWF